MVYIYYGRTGNSFNLPLNNGSVYKIIGKVNLGNIEDTDIIPTGDHDGQGIILEE